MDVNKKVNSKNSKRPIKFTVNTKSKNNYKLKNSRKKSVANTIKSKYVYNVDEMTVEDLQESLARVEKNPTEPFTFLTNINASSDTCSASTTTHIDIQLTTLSQRIQLNQSLLQETNNHVKKFNTSIQRKMKENIKNEDYSTVSEECYPSIDEMQGTLKLTIDTLCKMKELMNERSVE